MFRFSNIFIDFIRFNKGKKCEQFINHRVRRKKYLTDFSYFRIYRVRKKSYSFISRD